MRLSSALVGFCILSVAFGVAVQSGRPAYLCEVLLANFCPGNQNACPTDPAFTFGSNSYGFENFNIISFDSFYAKSGDVQGRAAIRNNLNLPFGQYSFGYELRTGGVSAADLSLPYALVVGRDAIWQGGAVLPDGSNYPYNGVVENIFVGGTFTATADLAARRTGGPCATAGCLDAAFDNAQAYYKLLSNSWNSQADSATYAIQYGGITLTCSSMAADTYVIHVTPNDFSLISYWNPPTGCNPQSALVVNIVGAGNQVKFAGNTQTFFKNERVIYNVVPGTPTPGVRVEVGINGNLLAPDANYNQPGNGVFIGLVIVGNVTETLQINRVYCAPQAPPPHPPPSTNLCPAWETACAGLDLVLGTNTYSFRDFNVISFQDFTADTGDIEGRLAVQRDATLGAGYSIGYELQTAGGLIDNILPYSLIVGRDLSWTSGALFPLGNGIPYPGPEEDMYVGGTFTTNQADLVARRTGGPCASTGCFDSTFNSAKTCYEGYSTTISNQPDNVAKVIQYSGMTITCNSATATDYVVSVTPADLSSITYFTLGNCNFQARWYINVRGTADVTLTGGSFPAVPGGIVWNIIGNRNVYVHDTQLGGHLLAPDSNLNQTGGVIIGKVVAGNIAFALQINKQNTCPNPTTVTIPSVVITPSIQSNEVSLVNNAAVFGDQIHGATIVGYKGDNTYYLNGKVTVAAGEIVMFQDSSVNGRPPAQITASPSASSASAVSMTFALVAALLALAF